MTILNVAIDEHRALIGTNTASVRHDGAVTAGCKLFVFPQAPAALCGRGQLVVTLNLFADLFVTMAGFDEMAKCLPAALQRRHAVSVTEIVDAGRPVPHDYECAFVGWSNAAQRMAAMHYKAVDGQELQIVDLTELSVVSPWLPEWGERGAPLDQGALLDLMQFQSQHMQGPMDACGGHAVLAELTKCGVATALHPL
jgi:hypothetical protein